MICVGGFGPALIEVTEAGLLLREVAPGVTPELVQEQTQPRLQIASDCKEMDFGGWAGAT